MAGQNSSALSLMSPKTAGSEPIGSSVAETSATTNTVLRPNSGSASHPSIWCSQASIRHDYGQAHRTIAPQVNANSGQSGRAILCLLFQHSPLLSMRIGQFDLPNRLFVAPMAGVTDRPFRKLCKRLGAG